MTDAELDDIQRDAESTARLVGAPGSPVRMRAEATVRLVAEVRRLRRVEEAARAYLDARDGAREWGDDHAAEDALRAALGGES